ncbi:MAG: UrcA family protein [Alphaproteobacteria bacterium]|nr:UrcA family protein [Alphaproteobacteria bacterium]
MADKDHTKDDGHGGDHGGDHGDHGGGDKHAKTSGGGNRAANLLRNPITWAVAGVGALLVAVFASGVPTSTVGTSPSSYDVSDSSDATDGSSPAARRSARYSARTCAAKVEQARAAYGRDWESELPRKVRADCGHTIQEARRDDRRSPQQAEGPRGRGPGTGDVEVKRLDVAYGDLDLSTSMGAERFLQRLERAAISVCGGQPDIRDLEARRAFKDCVERSMDSAVAQIRAPRVTALHRRAG